MAFWRVNSGHSSGGAPARPNSEAGIVGDASTKSSAISRRAMLAGGIGATALVAVPDMARAATSATAARTAAKSAAEPTAADTSGHFFLYGITTPQAQHSGGVQSAGAPASASGSAPSPVTLATELAAAPVASPDHAWLAMATVSVVGAEPAVTLTIVEKATAATVQKAVVSLRGVPADASILVSPVFSPDASVVTLVLGISVPSNSREIIKRDPRTGGTVTMVAADWRSEHALAYFDRKTGSLAGPFYLKDSPSLSKSTAVVTATDLFLWTTPDPRATPRSKSHPVPPPLPSISAFPLGEGKARFRAPSPAPWPGGEPVGALANGDVARFVNARTLQVVAASNGDIRQVAVAPLAAGRAKPSPVTMTSGPDETLFLAKPSIGRAVIVDPASEFAVRNDISFAVPAKPSGGQTSKAVLSPSGDLLYVIGGAKSGGLAAYDVATGKIAGAYSDGRQYSGLYLLPSGTLLAVSQENPRLAYFSPELSPLATADTSLYVSSVY
jgi:hypothetical protein